MTSAILTAASEKYKDSLYSLIGSLNCNWIDHPKIIVYDLGLSSETISILNLNGIVVREIPPFCSHWRKHYTWKLWCLHNSDYDLTIWMDAGLCILDSLDDVIQIIEEQSYFIVPHYQFLDYEATIQACIACGLNPSFRYGKGTITTAFIGFKKNSPLTQIIKEAYYISLDEANIKVDNKRQRPEQSLIGLLIYKYIPNPKLVDGIKFLGWSSPRMVNDQKVWQQRRSILKEDVKIYRKNLGFNGEKHLPKDPKIDINVLRKLWNKFFTLSKSSVKKFFVNERIDGIR